MTRPISIITRDSQNDSHLNRVSFADSMLRLTNGMMQGLSDEAAVKSVFELAHATALLPDLWQHKTPRFKGSRAKRKVLRARWLRATGRRVAHARYAYPLHVKAAKLYQDCARLTRATHGAMSAT